MLYLAVWIMAALIVARGITWDMHALRVHRMGVERWGWWLACGLAGPLAGLVYLGLRPGVRRRLLASVWACVGNATVPASLRKVRLFALYKTGMVGEAMLDECLRQIEAQQRSDSPRA